MHTVFDKRQKVLLLLRSFEVVVCDLSRFGVVARFVVLCRVVESTMNLLFGLRSRTIGRYVRIEDIQINKTRYYYRGTVLVCVEL